MARLQLPTIGRKTQGFGDNPAFYAQVGQKGHNGYDYGVPVGSKVFAAEAGTVEFEGWGQNNSYMGKVAGICAIIDHGDIKTGYAHLSRTIVNNGQRVAKGQLIGYSGRTGLVTGPHLHFEVFGKPVNIKNGYYGRIDPAPFFVDTPQNSTDTLNANQAVGGNQFIQSKNGRYKAIMQTDGNFVVYDGSKAIWATNTVRSGAITAIMQSDGNFVLYNPNKKAVWASRTNGKGGVRIVMQNDGNLVIYKANGAPVWASKG